MVGLCRRNEWSLRNHVGELGVACDLPLSADWLAFAEPGVASALGFTRVQMMTRVESGSPEATP
jgi:hypothetical protein